MMKKSVCVFVFFVLCSGPGRMFAARVKPSQKNLEGMDEKEGSEWCNPFSRLSEESLYFQEMESDGVLTAFSLEIRKSSAQLLVHRGHEWQIESDGKDAEWKLARSSIWSLMRRPVDFLENVRYIEIMPEIIRDDGMYIPDSLVFHYNWGRKRILKGSYLPRKLLENQLQKMNVTELENLTAQLAQLKLNSTNQTAKKYKKTVRAAAKTGAVAGGVVSAVPAYMLGAWLSSGVNSAANVASLVTVFLGGTAFIGAGAMVGAVALAGIPALIGASLWAYKAVKGRREMHLSAAEKIFESLKCHKTMTKCSHNVLVPKSDAAQEICDEARRTPEMQ